MYSVLIVDDEQIIRNSIHTMLLRMNDSRIGEIHACANAEEALVYCEDHHPDIVITDIVMGDKNGIELLSMLNQRLHSTGYLVISGYDSYQYIRSAFQEGAVDYLLKPILYPEFEKAIHNMCDHLDMDQMDHLNRSFQKLILSLQQGQTVNASLFFPEYEPSKTFDIALLAYPSHNETEMDQVISGPALSALSFYKATCFQSGNIIYIMLHNPVGSEDLSSFMHEHILCHSSGHLIPAVAADRCTLDSLFSAFSRLSRCIAFRLRNNYGRIYIPTPEDDNASMIPRNYAEISRLLNICRYDNLDSITQEICNLFRHTRPCDLYSTYQIFTSTLHQTAIQQETPLEISSFPSFRSFLTEDDLMLTLQKMLREYIVKQRSAYPDFISQIKNYIETCYDHKLSLSDVAEHFSISYAHLSHVFSSTMNMSFTEYVTLIRMQHARQMIYEPKYTIQEIAFMCGYENQFSFTRAFKKHYGISPTGYRKALEPSFDE